MKLAIASSSIFKNEVSDDLWLLRALKKHNINAQIQAWDDPNVNWNNYNVVLLKSTWGYHSCISSFISWLNMLEVKKIKLINPISIVKQNINKNAQRLELEKNKIPVLDSVYLSLDLTNAGTQRPMESLYETIIKYYTEQNDFYVIKPIISASSNKTFKIELFQITKEQEKEYSLMINNNEAIGVILQPYQKTVENGEYSLIYINGELSHAVIRFSIFSEFKNKVIPIPIVELPQSVRILGNRVMKYYNEKKVCYSRVDIILADKGPLVMEVEMAEPDLFFYTIHSTSERNYLFDKFAESIISNSL